MSASPVPELQRPLLEVQGLTKHFPVHGGLLGREVGRVQAVTDLALALGRGRTLGLVGESGCGKSTAGRLILRLIEPDAGSIRYDGLELRDVGAAELRRLRRELQLIFQDPYASLNPRLSVGEIIEEALIVHGIGTARERRDRIVETLQRVGLRADLIDRYPHEFSGGQRQRIGIARALVLEPKLIVADEPVSALDVSIQASVINLMREIQGEFGIAFIMIAHDLAVVEHMSDEVAVMYLGRIVETAPAGRLSADPKHPYTEILVASAPALDPRARQQWARVEGEVPSPMNPPAGCPFHPRCPKRFEPCATLRPALQTLEGGNRVACHLYGITDADAANGPS